MGVFERGLTVNQHDVVSAKLIGDDFDFPLGDVCDPCQELRCRRSVVEMIAQMLFDVMSGT